MAGKKKFYITTTIPYANAPPHIGFALEIVQADIIARWNRLLGKDVFFLTGTDEHGVKNYKMSKESNMTPQAFVDKNSAFFRELTQALDISNNNFIRTTDKKAHWPGVIDLWKILVKKGDIYKKEYEGCYCAGCERFVTEKDLVEGKCPDHPNLTIERIKEENYFFKLSKYSEKITDLIKKDRLKIHPQKWKNDFLSLIKDGLTDVSFSRDKEHLPWGIPVPGDENQVLYVWPDALTNYLTGIGYPDRKYKKFWPADLHVVGKDMLRFHTGIWPGMLLSAGIELPKQVIVHGFLTVDGQKMSKSLGNVVSPLELRKKYNSDSIRYYLARTIPFGEDGDFSEKHLIERHNNELANKLGNLVSRVSALIETNGMQKTPNKLIKKLRQKEIESHMEKYEFDKALNLVFEFIDTLNEHIQEKKPWETKDKKTLYELADSIKVISILLWSFIPSASGKISETFNFKIGYNEIKKPLAIKAVKKPGILFNKIEIGNQKIDKLQNPAPKMVEGIASIVDFTDWQKLDLRVGEIQQVEDIPGADKLYKITVNIGEIRTVCAGLKQFYSKEDLRGKKIILFTNLAPRKMKGIESQGMILAAVNKNETKVSLIQPDEDIEVGSRVM